MKLFTAVSMMLYSIVLPGALIAQNAPAQGQSQMESNWIQVSGIIRDDENQLPIQSVTITDNRYKALGISKADGSFEVSVPAGTRLVFSAVSFTTQSILVSNAEKNLSIILIRESRQLENVVV